MTRSRQARPALAVQQDWEQLCDELYERRPEWIRGYISLEDARFLFAKAVTCGEPDVVEIGTASGLSTAVIATALGAASAAGFLSRDWSLRSYDIDTQFYADRSRRSGDAARELLSEELQSQVAFVSPATALDVRRERPADSLGLLFLDANHRHPWPVLDVITTLDCLRPGAAVLLHDINLPTVCPDAPDHGPLWLFDQVQARKETPEGDDVPNIGSITVPEDKEGLRQQLLRILYDNAWEDRPTPDDLIAALGGGT